MGRAVSCVVARRFSGSLLFCYYNSSVLYINAFMGLCVKACHSASGIAFSVLISVVLGYNLSNILYIILPESCVPVL